MSVSRSAELITSVCFLLLAVWYLVESSRYMPGARLIPSILAGCTIVVVLVQLASYRFSGLRALVESEKSSSADTSRKELLQDPAYRRRVILIFFWILLLYLLILALGFVVGIPSFVFLFLALLDRKSWLLTVLLSSALGALSYFLIGILLNLRWDSGWLWTWWG